MDSGSRPFVVAHVAVSLDGATGGFQPDVGRFYALASTWHEQVTLTGADTILAQEPMLAAGPGPGPAPDGPILAVVDGRGRVSEWRALYEAGFWSDVVALHTESTPSGTGVHPASTLVVGAERVDLTEALRVFAERYGAEVVRVDSGGSLTAALLDADLLDEVSLLLQPCIVGSACDRRWCGGTPPPRGLELISSEAFDDGVVWLRYRVAR